MLLFGILLFVGLSSRMLSGGCYMGCYHWFGCHLGWYLAGCHLGSYVGGCHLGCYLNGLSCRMLKKGLSPWMFLVGCHL